MVRNHSVELFRINLLQCYSKSVRIVQNILNGFTIALIELTLEAIEMNNSGQL